MTGGGRGRHPNLRMISSSSGRLPTDREADLLLGLGAGEGLLHALVPTPPWLRNAGLDIIAPFVTKVMWF